MRNMVLLMPIDVIEMNWMTMVVVNAWTDDAMMMTIDRESRDETIERGVTRVATQHDD